MDMQYTVPKPYSKFNSSEFSNDRINTQKEISQILNGLSDKYGFPVRANLTYTSNQAANSHNHHVEISILI